MSLHLPTPEEDPSYHNVTAALGRIITCWARVEDELAGVFSHAANAGHLQGRAVFYSVRSFEARLDLVVAAVKTLFPPLLLQLNGEWETLLNVIGRKSARRNEAAHCAIIETISDDGKRTHHADPFCAYSGKLDRNPQKLLSCQQLLDRAEGFIVLAARIGLFEESFAEHLGRSPTSALLRAFPHLRAEAEKIRIQSEASKRPPPSDP